MEEQPGRDLFALNGL